MACLCAPTTHEGSFRCRRHRGNKISKYPPRPSIPRDISDLQITSRSAGDPMIMKVSLRPSKLVSSPADNLFPYLHTTVSHVKRFREKQSGLSRPSGRPRKNTATGPSRLSRMVVACAQQPVQQNLSPGYCVECLESVDFRPAWVSM